MGLLFLLRNQKIPHLLSCPAHFLSLRFLTGLPTEWVLPTASAFGKLFSVGGSDQNLQREWKSCWELAVRTKLSQRQGNCLSGVLGSGSGQVNCTPHFPRPPGRGVLIYFCPGPVRLITYLRMELFCIGFGSGSAA